MPRSIFHKSDANRVTIYIWKSNLPFSLGHVSLRTYTCGISGEGVYASWWPAEGGKINQSSYRGVKSRNPKNLEEDSHPQMNNKRPPDESIDLYSLDVDKINKAYLIFLNSNYNWSTLGSGPFAKEDTKNCASLVYLLLGKGGIKHLIIPAKEVTATTGENLGRVLGALLWAGQGVALAYRSMQLILSVINIDNLEMLEAQNDMADLAEVVMPEGDDSTSMIERTGSLMGSGVGIVTDTTQGKSNIITPNGIYILLNEARETEKKLYDMQDNKETGTTNARKMRFCTLV